MGSRPGYADERPHGRYAGRSSGAYGPPGECCLFYVIKTHMLDVFITFSIFLMGKFKGKTLHINASSTVDIRSM